MFYLNPIEEVEAIKEQLLAIEYKEFVAVQNDESH